MSGASPQPPWLACESWGPGGTQPQAWLMGAPRPQPGKAGHSKVPGPALGLDFSAEALSSMLSPLQDQGGPERGAGAKCCEGKAPPQRRTCPVTQHPPCSRLQLESPVWSKGDP